ncbi:DUF1311 domain-containing protein, partial [Myxococcota bacterium]|nr:DUF1311 domain-containing protein [Myxococcota bacterium]
MRVHDGRPTTSIPTPHDARPGAPSTASHPHAAPPDAPGAARIDADVVQNLRRPRGAQEGAGTAVALRAGQVPFAETQAGMNEAEAGAATRASKGTRAALAAYAKTLDAETRADLTREQQAFEAFVDAEATLQGNALARGGSMMPMIASGAARAEEEARTRLLRGLVSRDVDLASSGDFAGIVAQQEMNAVAYEALAGADRALGAVVAELERHLDPETRADLAVAQAAFAEYRDHFATTQGNAVARGGTLAPLIAAGAAEWLTRERTAELRTLVADLADR